MRRNYTTKLSATGWMKSQLLRSRRESLTAAEIFDLIKSAESLERENIQFAYVCGAEDVQDANLYGYERRFSPQYYKETYGGGEPNCGPIDPNIKSTTIFDPATGKTYTPETYKGGEQ